MNPGDAPTDLSLIWQSPSPPPTPWRASDQARLRRKAEGSRPDGSGPGSDLLTLARGSFLTMGGSIISSVLAFLLVIVITRGLHARGAGILFEAIALFTILSNSAELGADTGLVRMVASYRAVGRGADLRSTIWVAVWPVMAAGSVLAALMFVFAPQLASVFIHGRHQADGIQYIRLFAPFLPLAAVTTVALSGTRGFGTIIPFVAVQNLGIPGLRPLLVIVAIGGGLGATGIALAWAIPVGLGFAVTIWTLFRLLRRSERHERRTLPSARPRALASEFWRFSAPRGLAGVFMVALLWLNILILGALSTSRQAGIYAAASRYVGLGTFALAAIGIAIAPQISVLLAREQRARAETVFQTATWWIMVPAWPVYLSIAAFAPWFMKVFGHDFRSGGTTLVILALGTLSLVGTGNNKIVLLMGGGSAWNLFSTIIAFSVNLGLDFLLIPHHGMIGAAIAFAASLFADNAITTIVVMARMKLHPFGRGYPVVAIGSAVCYGGLGLAIRRILGISPASLALFASLSTGLYVALLYRFRGVLQFAVLKRALGSRRQTGGRSLFAPMNGHS